MNTNGNLTNNPNNKPNTLGNQENQAHPGHQSNPGDYLLHLEDVYVRYRNPRGEIFTVLNDVDLKVSSGEFVTIVGPSGCGKSTMLRLILGSEGPTGGSVLFEGKPIESPDRNRGIVFQKYSLFPHLTVLDNLIFGLDAEDFTIPGRLLKPFHIAANGKNTAKKPRITWSVSVLPMTAISTPINYPVVCGSVWPLPSPPSWSPKYSLWTSLSGRWTTARARICKCLSSNSGKKTT